MQIKGLQADGMDWKNVTTSKVLEEHGVFSQCDLGIICFGHLGFSGRSWQHERPHPVRLDSERQNVSSPRSDLCTAMAAMVCELL